MNKPFTTRNLRKTVLLCLSIFVLNTVSAQTNRFQFGVRGGFNLSTALVNDASAMKFRPGYHIGATVDYMFTPKFELQSGLFLSKQGSVIEDLNSGAYVGGTPDWTHTFDQLYLQIPLYAAFRKNISTDLNLSIGFGPYFGYGIGGKTNKELNNSTYFDGGTKTEWDTFGNGVYDESRDWLKGEYLNPFDFGAGIKFDVEYRKMVFGIGLETSIIDIMNREGYEDLNYRNASFRLSAGYRF